MDDHQMSVLWAAESMWHCNWSSSHSAKYPQPLSPRDQFTATSHLSFSCQVNNVISAQVSGSHWTVLIGLSASSRNPHCFQSYILDNKLISGCLATVECVQTDGGTSFLIPGWVLCICKFSMWSFKSSVWLVCKSYLRNMTSTANVHVMVNIQLLSEWGYGIDSIECFIVTTC